MTSQAGVPRADEPTLPVFAQPDLRVEIVQTLGESTVAAHQFKQMIYDVLNAVNPRLAGEDIIVKSLRFEKAARPSSDGTYKWRMIPEVEVKNEGRRQIMIVLTPQTLAPFMDVIAGRTVKKETALPVTVESVESGTAKVNEAESEETPRAENTPSENLLDLSV